MPLQSFSAKKYFSLSNPRSFSRALFFLFSAFFNNPHHFRWCYDERLDREVLDVASNKMRVMFLTCVHRHFVENCILWSGRCIFGSDAKKFDAVVNNCLDHSMRRFSGKFVFEFSPAKDFGIFNDDFLAVYGNDSFVKNLKDGSECCRILMCFYQCRNNDVSVNDSIITHHLQSFSVRTDFCIDFVKRHILKSVFLCFLPKLHESFFSVFKGYFSCHFHAERNSAFFYGFLEENPERRWKIQSELLENADGFILQVLVHSYLYQCACHALPPELFFVFITIVCESKLFVNDVLVVCFIKSNNRNHNAASSIFFTLPFSISFIPSRRISLFTGLLKRYSVSSIDVSVVSALSVTVMSRIVPENIFLSTNELCIRTAIFCYHYKRIPQKLLCTSLALLPCPAKRNLVVDFVKRPVLKSGFFRKVVCLFEQCVNFIGTSFVLAEIKIGNIVKGGLLLGFRKGIVHLNQFLRHRHLQNKNFYYLVYIKIKINQQRIRQRSILWGAVYE